MILKTVINLTLQFDRILALSTLIACDIFFFVIHYRFTSWITRKIAP